MLCRSCFVEEHECDVVFMSGNDKQWCSCPQRACREARVQRLHDLRVRGRSPDTT